MRFETPVVAGGRYATADFEIGGEQVQAGDELTRVLGRGQPRRRPASTTRSRSTSTAPPSGTSRSPAASTAASARTWRAWSSPVILGALHERIPDYALDPDHAPGYNNVADPHRRPAAAGVHAPLTRVDERQQHREVGVDVAAPEVVAGVGDHRELDRRQRRLPLRRELVAHERALAATTDHEHRAPDLGQPVPQRDLAALGEDLAHRVLGHAFGDRARRGPSIASCWSANSAGRPT